MSSNTILETSHYARDWKSPNESEFNDLQVVNQLGIAYAKLPNGPAKEARLLEIAKCFHGYVFKYADLITRGHIPTHHYNGDTRRFLTYFLPPDNKPTRAAFSKAAHHLHLAFPQQTSSDVYDILNTLLLRCVKKYDPDYNIKVQKVIHQITKFKKKKYFTIKDIEKKVSFDPIGPIRLLAKPSKRREAYIKAVRGPSKQLLGYRIKKNWPPNKSVFINKVGFVHVVQTWFRYYLQEYIDEQMKTLEARAWDKMLQLEHRTAGETSEVSEYIHQDIPHAEGNLVDNSGNAWAVDKTLMTKSLDLSHMTKAWIQHTDDKMFSNMTKRERKLLYLYYVQELPWKQIAISLNMAINQVQKLHSDILVFLKGKFNAIKTI